VRSCPAARADAPQKRARHLPVANAPRPLTSHSSPWRAVPLTDVLGAAAERGAVDPSVEQRLAEHLPGSAGESVAESLSTPQVQQVHRPARHAAHRPAPPRTKPHRAAPNRTKPHQTATRRAAPNRTAPHARGVPGRPLLEKPPRPVRPAHTRAVCCVWAGRAGLHRGAQ